MKLGTVQCTVYRSEYGEINIGAVNCTGLNIYEYWNCTEYITNLA